MGGGSRVIKSANWYLLTCSTPELLAQPPETTFVNHLVQLYFFGKEAGCLYPEVEPLHVDLTFRAISCDDQKTKAVDVTLEIPIRCLFCIHNMTTTRR